MNEPSNFVRGSQQGCPDNELENPPYVPGEPCLPAWNGDSAGVGDLNQGVSALLCFGGCKALIFLSVNRQSSHRTQREPRSEVLQYVTQTLSQVASASGEGLWARMTDT